MCICFSVGPVSLVIVATVRTVLARRFGHGDLASPLVRALATPTTGGPRSVLAGRPFEPSCKIRLHDGSNSNDDHERIRSSAVPTFAIITNLLRLDVVGDPLNQVLSGRSVGVAVGRQTNADPVAVGDVSDDLSPAAE